MTDTRSIAAIAPLGSYLHPVNVYNLVIGFSVCVYN